MSGGPTNSERRGWAVCVGLSVALTALIFNRVVFAGEWLARRDTLRVYLPLAKYWADRVKRGEFPEWYPFNALGQPYVGMGVSAPFHPARLLYLFLPLEDAHSLHTLLCYPVAAAFTYACARRLGLTFGPALFAALTFAGSGYLVSISNNLAYLVAAATIPAMLWAADRYFERPSVLRLGLAGALLTLVLFAGDIQSFVLAGAAATVLALVRPLELPFRARLLRLTLVLGVGIGLAMPQLLPAWETLHEARANANPLRIAESFSLHPLRLVELPFGPLFIESDSGLIPEEYERTGFIDKLSHSEWVDSITVGAVAFVFAIAGAFGAVRRRVGIVFIAAALLSVALILGRHLPVYALFFRFVPLWNAFRYPEKLTVWLTLLLSLGAGFGLHRALSDPTFARRVAVSFLVLAAIAAALMGAVTEGQLASWGVPTSHTGEVLSRLDTQAAATFIACIVAALALVRLRPSISGPAISGLNAVWLVWLALPIPQTIKLDVLNAPSGLLADALAAGAGKPGGPRVDYFVRDHLLPTIPGYTRGELDSSFIVASMSPDAQALFGLETSAYYHPAGSNRMLKGYSNGAAWQRVLAPLYGTAFFTTNFRDAAGAGRVSGNKIIANLKEWGVLLWQNERAQPRAYVARPRCVKDTEEALAAVTDPSFTRGVEVILECGSTEPRQAFSATPPGEARIDSYEPERVELSVSADEDAVVVLNDAFYSGWSVTVDGREAQVLPANVAVRGVKIGKGQHRVIFEYRQPLLRAGLLVALCIALLLAAAHAAPIIRRWRSPSSTARVLS